MNEAIWTWAWPWWSIIVAINVVNLIIGIFIFVKSTRTDQGELNSYHLKLRIAGIIFIGVAFYRSIFVSNYLLQLAWFDTLFNSSLVIRFFATFAELSFAYLIMAAMLQLNKEVPSLIKRERGVKFFFENKAPYLFFICLAVAQFFAYGGTITKVDLFFAIEETLWGLAFLSITPLAIIQFIRIKKSLNHQKGELLTYKIFTTIIMVFCIGYGAYSLFYHLPLEYWPGAINQLQVGDPDPAFRFGFSAIKDALLIVNVSRDYATWGGLGFIIWHSGYFTLCGWMVLFFMSGPKLKKRVLSK